jgi:mRNA interferase MazF
MNKGEVYLVKIPSVEGYEQQGARPAIIFSKEIANIVSIIPLTTNQKALGYEQTLKINKSEENGLNSDSVALIFQLRAIDKKRIINKIGILNKDNLIKLDILVKKLLMLK